MGRIGKHPCSQACALFAPTPCLVELGSVDWPPMLCGSDDVNIVETLHGGWVGGEMGKEKPSRGTHMSAVPLPGDNSLGRASCGVRLLDPETGKKTLRRSEGPPHCPPHELVAPTVARPFSRAGAQWAPGTEKAWKNYRGESYLLVAHCPGGLIQCLRGESSS